MLHMLVTRVPVVDVMFFTRPTDPITQRYTLRWSKKVEEQLLKRDLLQAIEQYKKLRLPRFRADWAGAARRAIRAPAPS